jgi:hypothetical protein
MDAETYLHDLRRALPIGCRRRFVAELREHFASAVAAEAEHGVDRTEAARLTIERLGPADALAAQLLADLRSGALGPAARLSAALTTARLAACGGAAVLAIAAGAVFTARHSSPPARVPQQTAARPATVTLDPATGEVRGIIYTVQSALREHQSALGTVTVTPFDVTSATPRTYP